MSFPMTRVCLFAAALSVTIPHAALADSASETTAAENTSAEAPSAKPAMLTIGSRAPQLDIEHWVQDGEGKFEPVSSFTEGQVYVVEFWATWCGPCVASMPHLSELQRKYAEQGVTIVSVSDEDLETVNTFLDREAQARGEGEGEGAGEDGESEPVTFRDITKHYCLTTDPDGSVNQDYMRAAGQNGIPCAFVVGKDGHIEWIGHPMQMDGPLEQVVTDSWDRDAFAAEFKAQQELDFAMQKISRMVRAGRIDEARTMIDGLMEKAEDPRIKDEMQQMLSRIDLIELEESLASDPEGSAAKIEKILEKATDSPGTLFSLGNMLVRHLENDGELADGVLENTAGAFVAMLEQEDSPHPFLIHMHAKLVYHQGDLDRAIEIQQASVNAADGRLKAMLERYLNEIMAEKDPAAGEQAPAAEAVETEA